MVRANLVGHRGQTDPPVTLVLSVDGKPLKTVAVPVQISRVNQQGGATQRSSEEVRVFLPGNRHTFRAEFVDDTALQDIPANLRTSPNRNIFPESIELLGPFAPAEPHKTNRPFLPCGPAAGPICVDRILATLARRAYRRPVTRGEVGALIAVFDRAKGAGYTPAQSLQFAITAMLVSPQFLFHIEREAKPGAIAHISDVDLASRLSYFLWSSMPDDELLRLGETGQLHQPAVLDAQVKRMVASAKSSAFAENFAGQWLETRSLDAMKPDPKKFPEWTPELKDSMATETRLFFEAVLRDDRPISDFIDGKYTFLNELLAKNYGIEGVTGPEFRRVELTNDSTQRCLHTSECAHRLQLSHAHLGGPARQLHHGSGAQCSAPSAAARHPASQRGFRGSHSFPATAHGTAPRRPGLRRLPLKMDLLGFALENYDAIGRWRTQDGKFPIDATGFLPDGKSFNGPAEMKALLHDNMPSSPAPRRQDAHLRAWARRRILRPYRRPGPGPADRRHTSTKFNPWSSESCTARRSTNAGARLNPRQEVASR